MKNNTILIVEDSPTQAMQLKILLLENGYETLLAVNGREAIDMVSKQKPDLIVSDVMMPIMDGYEMCQKIKSDHILKNIPIILLTTLSDLEDIFHGLNVQADYYVTKPFQEKF